MATPAGLPLWPIWTPGSAMANTSCLPQGQNFSLFHNRFIQPQAELRAGAGAVWRPGHLWRCDNSDGPPSGVSKAIEVHPEPVPVKEVFQLGRMRIEPGSGHVFYDGEDLSALFMTLAGVFFFLDRFGLHTDALKELYGQFMRRAIFASHAQLIEELRKDGINPSDAFEENSEDSEWTEAGRPFLLCISSQIGETETVLEDPREEGCRIEIGDNSYFTFSIIQQDTGIAPELSVEFFSPYTEVDMMLSYNERGELEYLPGGMRHFASFTFPSTIQPEFLVALREPIELGGRAVNKVRLAHDEFGIFDISMAFAEAREPQYGGLRLDEYVNQAEISPLEITSLDPYLRKVWQAGHIGFDNAKDSLKTQTHLVELGTADDPVVLDRIECFELIVQHDNPRLSAPTHLISQEFDRLNHLADLSRELAFSILEERGKTELDVFVWDRNGLEWKYYNTLFFDRYGQRIIGFEEFQRGYPLHFQEVQVSRHAGLKKLLKRAEMEHARFVSHEPFLPERQWGVAEKVLEQMEFEGVIDFIHHLQQEEAGFFDRFSGRDLLNEEEAGLRMEIFHVGLYIDAATLTLINEYLYQDSGPKRREVLRQALVDRFFFTAYSQAEVVVAENCYVPADQKFRDQEVTALWFESLALAERVHLRESQVHPVAGEASFAPFTMILNYKDGKPVLPGTEPGSSSGESQDRGKSKEGLETPMILHRV